MTQQIMPKQFRRETYRVTYNLTYHKSVLGPKRLVYFFYKTIFNLKGNCVLRTLKNSFAIFWAWRTYTHTYTHTHTRLGQINSLKGSYLKRPKCLGINDLTLLIVSYEVIKDKRCFSITVRKLLVAYCPCSYLIEIKDQLSFPGAVVLLTCLNNPPMMLFNHIALYGSLL